MILFVARSLPSMDGPQMFAYLPLEIRNKIYSYILIECTKLKVPRHFQGSPYLLIAQSLPPCLLLNRQVLEEGCVVYLQQTVIEYNHPGYSGLHSFLSSFPNSAGYNYVRRLEHTHPQYLSATLKKSRNEGPQPRFFGDVMTSCTGLRELHLHPAVPSTFFMTRGRSRMAEEFALTAEMQLIFANPLIRSIKMTCTDGEIYEDSLETFKSWFSEQCRNKGREIDLEVKAQPVRYDHDHDPQRTMYIEDGVKKYFYQDFFG